MTFAHAITHQKHLAQSGRSTQSAVDIFKTLSVFTNEPIREQEIKLECINIKQYTREDIPSHCQDIWKRLPNPLAEHIKWSFFILFLYNEPYFNCSDV